MEREENSERSILIWTYVPPIIICLGTIGNFLTIITLNGKRTSTKRTSFSVYLTAMSVTDTLNLLVSVLGDWLPFVLRFDFRLLGGSVLCKLNYFSSILLYVISPWILVCLTVEKCLVTTFPFKFMHLSQSRAAYRSVSVVLGCLVALDAHFLYGFELKEHNNETNVCGFVDENYEYFFFNIWPWINTLLNFIIPAIIFITGNIAMLRAVKKSAGRVGSETSRKRSRDMIAITMLANLNYITLAMPFIVYHIICQGVMEPTLRAIFMNLINLNYAMNFYMYVLSVKRFRNDLVKVVKDIIWEGQNENMESRFIRVCTLR